MEKKCEKCGTMFEAVRKDSAFCSKPCYYAVWATKNADKRTAARSRYLERNKEVQAERVRAWHAAHPERVKEIRRAHYERNRGEIMARSQEYARENPEKVRAYKAKYQASDAGRLTGKATVHRRRARILANGGSFTREEFVALVERCGRRCVACATPASAVNLEPDHIVPIKLGGSNDIANIQPLCRSCNAKKAANVVNYLATQGGPPDPENGT